MWAVTTLPGPIIPIVAKYVDPPPLVQTESPKAPAQPRQSSDRGQTAAWRLTRFQATTYVMAYARLTAEEPRNGVAWLCQAIALEHLGQARKRNGPSTTRKKSIQR
jgi:hypothetical protein